MVGIIADSRIRTGMLCMSIFLSYSLPTYGGAFQQSSAQPVNTEKAKPSFITPVITAPIGNDHSNGGKKKKSIDEVKDAHIGPPPKNTPPKKIRVKPSKASHQNPVDVSTGRELVPVKNNNTKQSPSVK